VIRGWGIQGFRNSGIEEIEEIEEIISLLIY